MPAFAIVCGVVGAVLLVVDQFLDKRLPADSRWRVPQPRTPASFRVRVVVLVISYSLVGLLLLVLTFLTARERHDFTTFIVTAVVEAVVAVGLVLLLRARHRRLRRGWEDQAEPPTRRPW